MNPLEWDAPKLAVYAALFCIVFLRAGATYAIGRGVVAGVSRSRYAGRMTGSRYQKAAQLVTRYGAPVVAVCFLTVGFQTLVLLAAGALKMPLRRFIPALVAGGVLWALLYGTVGFVGLELWMMVYDFSPVLAIVGSVAVVAAFVGFVLWRRNHGPAQEEQQAPVAPVSEPSSR